MLILMDTTSSLPMYVQIENQIQFAIAAGRLAPGDALPSVRALSEHLDVNPNTVAKAYRDLEVLGLLHTRRGTGIYVRHGITEKCRKECRRRLGQRLEELVSEAHAAGLKLAEITDVVTDSFQRCDRQKVPSKFSRLVNDQRDRE